MSRVRKSEAQANAEALARRESTWTAAHAATWEARFDRGTPPADLRPIVIELRRAYRDEVPQTLHKHAVDDGGMPAYSGEFAAFLYASPSATDEEGWYRTPVRRALAAMTRSEEEATRQMGRIAAHVTVGGDSPEDAVSREIGGLHPWAARAIAHRALTVFWKRCVDVRLDLGRTFTSA